MKHIDLFTGIGGFTLACQWNGIETVVMCEKDPFRRAGLDRAWPGIPIIEDVREFTIDTLVNLRYNQLSQLQKEIIDMGISNPKYDNAVDLYSGGLSIQNIADFYGITRQAMWMILKRRGCNFRAQAKYGKENHFYRGGSSASSRVHDITERAIEKGILIRKTHCEQCSNTDDIICSHHDDYNKPLEVRWLCIKCHFEWHKQNKPIEQIIDFPPMDRADICSRGGQRKGVTPYEFQREIEAATATFILTAGVP